MAAKGIIRFSCLRYPEHDGDAPIFAPVPVWQKGCRDCQVFVVEGPYHIERDVRYPDLFSVVSEEPNARP